MDKCDVDKVQRNLPHFIGWSPPEPQFFSGLTPHFECLEGVRKKKKKRPYEYFFRRLSRSTGKLDGEEFPCNKMNFIDKFIYQETHKSIHLRMFRYAGV